MPDIGVREMAGALGVLFHGNLSRFQTGRTSRIQVFENRLQRTIGVDHALAVNSGTSALMCALVGAGIGPGDEVLVPAYTWVSTAAAPLAIGAVPILVEIDETLTIDPVDLARKITPRTRAIIPVHMRNLVADMDTIMKIAVDHDLVVIEDACQAIGVRYHGRRVGSIGHAGAFSFNHQKNVKCGEGGALLTSDSRIFARASMFHDVGSYTREGRFVSDEPVFVGLNLRMPEVSAAICDPQLARIDRLIARRQQRRTVILEELEQHTDLQVSRHNDPEDAVGISVIFPTADEAARFADRSGVHRLIDTGRHVYTNWESVLARRTYDRRFTPYEWAGRDAADDDQPSCPATLDILARTCSISVDPQVPIPMLRRIVRRRTSAA